MREGESHLLDLVLVHSVDKFAVAPVLDASRGGCLGLHLLGRGHDSRSRGNSCRGAGRGHVRGKGGRDTHEGSSEGSSDLLLRLERRRQSNGGGGRVLQGAVRF